MKFDFQDMTDASEDLVRLARHCAELAGDKALADWHQFHPKNVPWMLGRLYVIEVLDGGADFFFRLSGVLMKEIYGTELENVRLSQLNNGAMRDALKTNYHKIVVTGEPVFQKAVLRWRVGFDIHVQRLLIPFTGPGGGVHTILGGIFSDVPDDMLVLYRDNAPVNFSFEG